MMLLADYDSVCWMNVFCVSGNAKAVLMDKSQTLWWYISFKHVWVLLVRILSLKTRQRAFVLCMEKQALEKKYMAVISLCRFSVFRVSLRVHSVVVEDCSLLLWRSGRKEGSERERSYQREGTTKRWKGSGWSVGYRTEHPYLLPSLCSKLFKCLAEGGSNRLSEGGAGWGS